MELGTKLRENNQTTHPAVYLSENNYTITNKSYMKNEIPFEVTFSNKQLGNCLQDFHHLDHNHGQFHANGSSSNPIFGVQTPCFEPFESLPYGGGGGYSSNFDFYECKPFADHSNYNNGGHGQVMDNFQTTTGGYLNHHHHQHQISNPGDQVMMMMPYTFHQEMNKPAVTFIVPDEVSCVNNNNNIVDDDGNYYKNKKVGSSFNKNKFHSSSTKKTWKGGKKSNVVKGQWTIEEDRLLIRLVEQFGIRKWSHIAQMLPGRIGKQCRERWHNHLRPDIKKDIWSEEEDKALIEAHVEIGNKWAEIAKRLPGRTENSIKNHWNATKRRQFSKRKCRSKYPRGSLLQDYIKSLNLDSSTSAKFQGTAGRPAATSSKCLQASPPAANLEDLCPSITDRLVPEFDFNDVPDFNFDDKLFQESCSIDSLIDEIPCAPIVDHDKSLEILELPLDDDNVHDEEDPVLVIETEVKKELDLVEMISQANLP
ncbi:hypothetical protein Ddye_002320 [Dipteronia dyeriana]|uniref:Transcription factor MYB98 n=1 Tax=Dipteronia dyeriana TaxID=168575 RepID=A0AAE0CUC2_9ROSI|nr:hypothetical protein Ddye_002320 [Dipteronia dyeriana]